MDGFHEILPGWVLSYDIWAISLWAKLGFLERINSGGCNKAQSYSMQLWINLYFVCVFCLTRWFLPGYPTPQTVKHFRGVFIVNCHCSLENTNIPISHCCWSSWYKLLECLLTEYLRGDVVQLCNQTLLLLSSSPSSLLAHKPVRKTSSRFISGVLKHFIVQIM